MSSFNLSSWGQVFSPGINLVALFWTLTAAQLLQSAHSLCRRLELYSVDTLIWTNLIKQCRLCQRSTITGSQRLRLTLQVLATPIKVLPEEMILFITSDMLIFLLYTTDVSTFTAVHIIQAHVQHDRLPLTSAATGLCTQSRCCLFIRTCIICEGSTGATDNYDEQLQTFLRKE